jgi:hypothetical protein
MTEFKRIISGETADRYGWFHPVYTRVEQPAAVPER